MKKTIIRIVAVAMLALMVLTALPAFAYNIVGTAAAQTPVYKDTKGRKVELYVSGPVTINRQDNKSGMYNVTVSYDGKTYTGWVYPSAISGIGYDKSTGGSTSGTTGGTTSGVTGTYTATIATGAAINVNGTNYPVSVGGSINVNYRDAAGTQVNVSVGNVTGWVAASSLSGFRRNGSSISLSDLPTSGGTIGGTIGGTTTPAPTPYVNQNQNQNTASGTFSANLAAGTNIYKDLSKLTNDNRVGVVSNAGNITVNYRDASGQYVYVTIGSVAGWVPANAISNLRSTSSGSINVPNLPTSGGAIGGNTGSEVRAYDKAKSAVSKDNNIYVRSTATSSTKGATKLRSMRGKTFTVLGTDASGSFLYVDYNGTRGFVRAQDFTFTSGNVVEQKPNNNTGTNGNVTSNNTGMAAIGTPAGKGTGSSSEKWGSITIPGAGTYPIYGNYIGEKKGKTYYYYDYVLRKSYYYVHTTTAQGSQVAVVMGHNNRKKVGTSNSYFHNLHHIQNAILGKSSCEWKKCKESCSGYGKSISANWEGSSSWEVVAFFEVPKNKAYKNILPQMAQPWNYTTSQYLSSVASYVNTFSGKSWANTSALTDNGKYMMLVTCGDSGDNDSIAKLYMLLKAVG